MTASGGGSNERTACGTELWAAVLLFFRLKGAAHLLLKPVDFPAQTWRKRQLVSLLSGVEFLMILLMRVGNNWTTARHCPY